MKQAHVIADYIIHEKSQMETKGNSKNWFKWTCIVGLCSSIFMLGCCIYATIVLQQMQEIRSACATLSKVYDVGGMQKTKQTNEVLKPDQLYTNLKRHKRSAGQSEKKKKRKKKKKKLRAAHYQSVDTSALLDKTFPEYDDETCFFIKEMAGTLCRTKDFMTNTFATANAPFNVKGIQDRFAPSTYSAKAIRAFAETGWVNDKDSPFTLKDHGYFYAKYTGIHLIYSQVLFYDNKEAEILRLVQLRPDRHGQKEIQALTCHESVNKHGPSRYKSCGITGLFNLKKGDIIYLQNVFIDVTLNLKNSTTYLGAVLLK